MWTAVVYVLGGAVGDLVASCDLCEINHCHDGAGTLKFTQLIVWDWSPDTLRFDVQAWAIINSRYHRTRDGVEAITFASERPIRVKCRYYRETWTKHDPEVENRKIFPPQYRRSVW